MEQKDLRTKLPELGFSYDRNNEFNRDEDGKIWEAEIYDGYRE